MGDAVGNGGVDGVLGDVAFGAEVVGAAFLVFRQQAALHFHLVGRLPGSADHLTHPAHGLGIRGDHGDHAHVVQDVFRRDGFPADAGIGKGNVFRDVRVQVVTHHQHVQVFIDGVHGVGPCRVGGRRQYIIFGAGGNDVRGVAAAGAFGVEGVNAAAFEGGQGVFHKAGFVQGVGVDGHLDVVLVGHGQAVVDAGRSGAPVFVQFEADDAGFDLLFQRFRQAGVALAQEADVHGQAVHGLQYLADVPGARGTGGGVGAGGRAGATAEHGGHAAHQGFFHLLGADEVDVGVDAAGGEDFAFTGDDFGAGADDDGDVWLGVRVAGFADGGDAAFLDAHVGFDDAPPVEDEGVGDHGVHHRLVAALALAHAVADDFTAAEFYFVAVVGVVFFHFYPQFGVAQADSVPYGGAVHVGVGLSADFHLIPRCNLGAGAGRVRLSRKRSWRHIHVALVLRHPCLRTFLESLTRPTLIVISWSPNSPLLHPGSHRFRAFLQTESASQTGSGQVQSE